MAGINKAALCLVLLVAIGILASPVFAGLLNTGTPYNDGTKEWKGSTSFADPSHNLYGYVEWAVFKTFPFSGYTLPDNELAYVYQIFNTGTAPISSFSVKLANEAGNENTFSDSANGVTGNAPLATSGLIAPGSAWWDFAGIPLGGNSQGLVFSSRNKPLEFTGTVVDHGGIATLTDIPSPSSNAIPEPTVLVSLITALCFMATTFGVRRFYR